MPDQRDERMRRLRIVEMLLGEGNEIANGKTTSKYMKRNGGKNET